MARNLLIEVELQPQPAAADAGPGAPRSFLDLLPDAGIVADAFADPAAATPATTSDAAPALTFTARTEHCVVTVRLPLAALVTAARAGAGLESAATPIDTIVAAAAGAGMAAVRALKTAATTAAGAGAGTAAAAPSAAAAALSAARGPFSVEAEVCRLRGVFAEGLGAVVRQASLLIQRGAKRWTLPERRLGHWWTASTSHSHTTCFCDPAVRELHPHAAVPAGLPSPLLTRWLMGGTPAKYP
jgi:hypothetical protein